MYLQKVISKKKIEKKISFLVGVLKVTDKEAETGSESVSQRYGSADLSSRSVPNCHGSGTLEETSEPAAVRNTRGRDKRKW